MDNYNVDGAGAWKSPKGTNDFGIESMDIYKVDGGGSPPVVLGFH